MRLRLMRPHRGLRALVALVLTLCTYSGAVPTATAHITTGDGSWYWQNPVPQGNLVRDMDFIDASNGWAVGWGGLVLRTTDGGSTWSTQTTGITEQLNDVRYVTTGTLVAVGDKGTILRTTDYGLRWQEVTTTAVWNLNSVDFVDSQYGWVAGDFGTMFKTTDGGLTWNALVAETTWDLRGVEFVNRDTGWAVGEGGTIVYTNNGGIRWNYSPQRWVALWVSLESASFVSTTTGFIVGTDGTCLKTTDAGSTWATRPAGTEDLSDVAFSSPAFGWAVGANGTGLRTVNGGSTWFPMNPRTSKSLSGLEVLSSTTMFACGEWGVLRKSTNGGSTWTEIPNSQPTPPSVTDASLRDVGFIDAMNGWAVGDGGTILHTTNGGSVWATQTSGVALDLLGLAPLTSLKAWSVGDGGTILRTTDGGMSWGSQVSGVASALNGIAFVDDNHGWAVGDVGRILATSDGGANWASISATTAYDLKDITFADAGTIMACGTTGTIVWTNDGGGSWQLIDRSVVGTDTFTGIFAVTPTDAWAIAPKGSLLSTSTDIYKWDGLAWGQISSIPDEYLVDISFVDPSTGWAVGVDGAIFATRDAGVTWTKMRSGAGGELNAVDFFVGRGTGWVVGDHGMILHTRNAPGDNIAPTTSSNATATYANSALISLTASDNPGGSGIVGTYYTLAGETGELLYTGPIAISAFGTHTISFYSDDFAGNVESSHSVTFFVNDTLAPETDNDALPSYDNTAVVSLTATDTGSGLRATYYRDVGGFLTTYTGPIVFTGYGDHTLAYYSVDNLGQQEATEYVGFRIKDTLVPTTTSDADGMTYTNTGVITLTAVENPGGSGLAGTWYQLEGGDLTTYTGPITVSKYGLQTIEFFSKDHAGNIETLRTDMFFVHETQPPTTTSNARAWYDGQAVISLTATDGPLGSGVAYSWYSLSGGALTTYTGPIVVSADGNYTLDFFSRDLAGNVEGMQSVAFSIDDTVPPVTTSDAVPLYDDIAIVSLNATDTGAGVAHTYYRLTGGVLTTYTGPITVSQVGAYTLLFYSIDNFGQRETTRYAGFTVRDTLEPTTTSDCAGKTFINTGLITLSAVENPGGSGLLGTWYRLPGGSLTTYTGLPVTVNGFGIQTIEFFSRDNAGNTEVTRHDTYFVDDLIAPITTSTAQPAYDGRAEISLVATDPFGSGIAFSWYSLSGGAVTTYTGPIVVTSFGDHTLSFWSRDNAGNYETSHTVAFSIDDTGPPTTTSNIVPFYDNQAIVTLSATDTGVGVRNTYYRVAGGTLTTYTGPIVFSDYGVHAISFYSVDNLDHKEATKNANFFIRDTLVPTSTSDAAGQTYTNTGLITISAVDNPGGSGLAGIRYRISGGALTTYTGPIAVTGFGPKTIEYYAVDNAGNVEVTHSDAYYVHETIPPVTSSNALPAYDSNALITLTATDGPSGSGIAGTWYSLGGGALTTYTGPISITGIGPHTLEFHSEDFAGNVESTKSASFTISDLIAPHTTSNAQVSYTGSALISLTATDNPGGSGVAATYYSLGTPLSPPGAAWTLYTGPISVTTAGTYFLDFYSEDVVGNLETPHSVAFVVAPVGSGGTTTTPRSPGRIAGTDRYATSVLMSSSRFTSSTAVVIASGLAFPDALSASGLAGALGAPLLVVPETYLPSAVSSEIRRLGATQAYVIGGTAAVSASVASAIDSIANVSVTRIAGADRYGTSRAAAERIASIEGGAFGKRAFIARGDGYADALAVSPLAYAQAMPVLLVAPTFVPASTRDAITGLALEEVVIAGGTSAVTSGVESYLKALRGSSMNVVRVAGANRYATAANIAEFGIGRGWVNAKLVGFATGDSFADALGGGVYCGADKGVLLLTDPNTLSPETRAFVVSRLSTIERTVVFGGDAAVSVEVFAELDTLF